MFPYFSSHNTSYKDLRNTKLVGYLLLRKSHAIKKPYSSYVVIAKFCIYVFYSTLIGDVLVRLHSSFFKSISKVVPLCSKKKMAWPYASSIVAPMKNIKTLRNGSVFFNPCGPMRAHSDSIVSRISITRIVNIIFSIQAGVICHRADVPNMPMFVEVF